MNCWQFLLAPLVAAALVLLASHDAGASDLYSNIGPGGSISGLADRYPLGNYALDQHFSAVKASLTGGIDASGIAPMIAYFLAQVLWQITAFLANAVITLFAFAFDLDLVNGSSATGGQGALEPVGQAIANLYAHTFGAPWMVIGITLAGCWAMWHALVRRRYTETASALAMSLVFCLLALAVVSRPQETIGQATRWSNDVSAAFLSVTRTGDIATGPQARRGAADQLFDTLVRKPWVALQFGGTEHCIRPGTGSEDHDPVSVPVRPLPPGVQRRLQAGGVVTAGGKTCVSNTARYSSHFLGYPSGSDQRDAEYEAINTANPDALPESDKHSGYTPAIADKPAADAMEKGGQYQRLLLALVVFAGELGAFLLLGALAMSVVMAQVVVLLLACFSPVALVAATIPGRGHDLFKSWASHLITYLARKAAYSLILAILLAVLSALEDATSAMGWLASFSLQAALLWMVFLSRHKLANQLTRALGGHEPGREAQLRRLLGVAYATRTITPARRRSTPPRTTPTPEEPPVEENTPAPPPVDRERGRRLRARDIERPDTHHAAPATVGAHEPVDEPRGDPSAAAVAVTGEPARPRRQAHRHARAARADTAAASPGDSPQLARRPHRTADAPTRGDDAEARRPGTRDARDGSPHPQHRDDVVARPDLGQGPPSHRPPDADDPSLLDQLWADRQRLDSPPPPSRDGEGDRPVPPPRRPASDDGEPQR